MLVRNEIARLRKTYSLFSGCLFIQLGIVNEIARFPNTSRKDDSHIYAIKQARLAVQNRLTNIGLYISWRENMPQSTILIHTSKSDDELLADMNS